MITAPGNGDRIVQFLYRQLPYHPQRIESGTAWTMHLAAPLNVPAQEELAKSIAAKESPVAVKHVGASSASNPTALNSPDVADRSGTELLHGYLTTTISSATARPGDTFQARITQPVYAADHHLAVPEGAVLIGTVTQAKPAKSFGRKGTLRFSFRDPRCLVTPNRT
jgi:hypothetical protein